MIFSVISVLALAVALPADKQLIYDSIFAPTEVAFQPDDSARDLVQLPDGEIRHYGRKLVAGEVRRVYIASRDLGLNWELRLASTNEPAVCPNLPWKDLEPRPPITLRHRRPGRLAMACSNVCRTNDCYHAALAWSDDGGRTWKRSDVPRTPDVARQSKWDLKPHWFNDGCEPSVAELSDGTLLMALRTSGPHLAFSRSADGGETWSEPRPDPRFWQANTMPCLLKLKDGRLLMVWNNTEMLPTRSASEYPELGRDEQNGKWETVFTNRDAVHAAISEDDGRTWTGFREVLLNACRNEADFRELGNAPDMRWDKSVHQPQLLELPGGKVMLAVGQNLPRRILIFDLRWLYERGRETDFRHGLRDMSSFLYVKSLSGGWRGWAGHCAWNRTPGPLMEKDPFDPKSVRELVHLCRMEDPRLVSARQGLVWNFPAMRKGRVEIEYRVEGEGFRASVLDHWVNPCDERSDQVSAKTVRVTKASLGEGWQTVTADWNLPEGRQVSYLHLQTLADGPDAKGVYFRSLKALPEEK